MWSLKKDFGYVCDQITVVNESNIREGGLCLMFDQYLTVRVVFVISAL